MATLITEIDAARVSDRFAEANERVAAAAKKTGRTPEDIELLVATKYLPPELFEQLLQTPIRLVGENQAQALEAKSKLPGAEQFRWDFIGHLQSRKVPTILPLVQRIHSVSSDSVLARLHKHNDLIAPDLEILIEVNISSEPGKSGIAPDDLGAFIERCPLPVSGLMTMPPAVESAEENRRWFSDLRELAHKHGLRQLSMGTSQDYDVAIEEGATVVRLGGALLR